MIKPDALWNFFKSGPDLETIGRVCMALAGREDEIGEPLNKYEVGYLREIIRSDEWHEDAAQRISDRKRRDYLLKKEKITENEQKELEILIERLAVKPNLAKKAKMENLEKSDKSERLEKSEKVEREGKTEKAEISMYPSVHPSIRPSIRPSVRPSKEEDINKSSSSSPKPPSETPKPPEGAEEEAPLEKDSECSGDHATVDRDYIAAYFKRMRSHGAKNSSPEIESDFWQYLVMSDFKKGDGMPITKTNVHSTFTVWNRNRQKEARLEESDRNERQKNADEEQRKKDRAELLRANSFKFETDL